MPTEAMIFCTLVVIAFTTLGVALAYAQRATVGAGK